MPTHRNTPSASAAAAHVARRSGAGSRVATETACAACPARGGRRFFSRSSLRGGHTVEQVAGPDLSGNLGNLLSLPRVELGTAQGCLVASAPGATNAGVPSHSSGVSPGNRNPVAAVDACGSRGGEVGQPNAGTRAAGFFSSTAARGASCICARAERSREGRVAVVSHTPGRASADNARARNEIPRLPAAMPIAAPGARPGSSLQVAL